MLGTDADKAAEWLAVNVCEKERQVGQVREELLAHLKDERIEPPARDRVRRIIGTALRQAEQALRIASRIPADAVARMLALIARAADPGEEEAARGEAGTLFGAAEVTGVDVFAAIRDEPGNVSVKTIGQETFKLGAIRAVGLPDDLFADVAPKVLASWRARVAAEAPSHLRSHPHEVMVTLLAAYLYCRHREITDALADLLIATVHRINARADTKVTSDFVAELKRVSGKENILFKMTEAALQSPGERVEDVIYPVVPGGQETLVALLQEFKAKGTSYRQHLQRETESGLNVVENYNGVNDYIRFGKRGELASNRREEQELGMLCLHVLQSSLGLINTLMIQDTLALPEWAGVLTDADRRGLTPIFHTNMTPYGEIQLRTDRRLDLTGIRDAAKGAT